MTEVVETIESKSVDLIALDALVRSLYSLQRLRIQTGNRLVANVKATLGQTDDMSEEELSPESQNILAQLRQDYTKVSDSVKTNWRMRRDFQPVGMITAYAQFCLLSEYIRFELSEKEHEKYIKQSIVGKFPIYETFLEKVPGCGPVLAAVILTRLDPHKAKYASSFWKFAGLDVAGDGRGRGKYKEHLVPKEYLNAQQEVTKTVGITFDPFLKTKLIGVLGPAMLKAAAVTKSGTLKYDEAYRNYKNRLNNSPQHAAKTLKHRHNMAIRYMVKLFLADLYEVWRPLEGLPVWTPYAEAKLGLKHDHDATMAELYPHQTAAKRLQDSGMPLTWPKLGT